MCGDVRGNAGAAAQQPRRPAASVDHALRNAFHPPQAWNVPHCAPRKSACPSVCSALLFSLPDRALTPGDAMPSRPSLSPSSAADSWVTADSMDSESGDFTSTAMDTDEVLIGSTLLDSYKVERV